MQNQLPNRLLRFAAMFLFFLAGTPSVFAQKFGFDVGVKGGIPMTEFLKATGVINGVQVSSVSRSSEFLVGPAAELTIPFGFAIEVNGLYHQAEYNVNFPPPSSPLAIKANSWELPYLAKFRLPIPLIKPFILGGGAYRTFTDLSPNVSASKNGVVIGAGIELKIRRLRLSAEGRYLHWASSSGSAPVRVYSNQGEFLMGAMF
jgi:Outer membrane protein beta-barrel domain